MKVWKFYFGPSVSNKIINENPSSAVLWAVVFHNYTFVLIGNV